MELSTHAQRLERWIGADMAAIISKGMEKWPGPPVAVMGVPGRVYARGGGDFCGPIRGGFYGNLADFAAERYKRVMRNTARRSLLQLNTGFSSLSDLISEATTGGKLQQLYYQKTTTVAKPAAAYCQDVWNMGAVPAAGSNGGAAPGGTNYDNTSTGALPFASPGGSDTAHLTTWTGVGTVVGALMLVDRLFGVSLSHNSANTNVTGVPGRYQDATAAGSFISARVTTVLTATAHNITITYMDQAGNVAEAGSAQAARVSAAVGTIPLTTPQWFYYLNSGDTGVRKITNWTTSAGNTGVSDVYIAHALAILPMLTANVPFILDGINSAFSLVKILAGACLTFVEYFMPATTVGTFTGIINVVSG